jgi:hypothetical protein
MKLRFPAVKLLDFGENEGRLRRNDKLIGI